MMRALRDFLGEKLMDGWRSVSPKSSHVIAIRKIETPRMVAGGAGECGDGIFFLLYRIGCSFLVVLKPKALAADTIIGTRLIIWACMEKVNPDLVVRDKQGRSYAEREFSGDRGYKAAPVSVVQTKWPFNERPLSSFKSEGRNARPVTSLCTVAPYQAHRGPSRATSRSFHHRGPDHHWQRNRYTVRRFQRWQEIL